jgi:hypothetical protein
VFQIDRVSKVESQVFNDVACAVSFFAAYFVPSILHTSLYLATIFWKLSEGVISIKGTRTIVEIVRQKRDCLTPDYQRRNRKAGCWFTK